MRYNFKSFLQRFIEEPESEVIFKYQSALPVLSVNGPWIAGGSIRRTLQRMPLDSDVDFFFKNEKQRKEFEKDLESRGFESVVITEQAKTFIGKINDERVKVQSIHFAYYENAEAVIDSFDFTITQFAYDGNDLICGEYSLWDLARNRLALHKMTYGVSTVRRLIKYTKQGFTACGGVLTDILTSVVNDPALIQSNVQYID